MARTKKNSLSSPPTERSRPPLTMEARENQLISLAMDVAEQKLRDGTASSQLITHYLKLGSTKERREQEKMAEEIKLLKAKTTAIESAERIERLYADAIAAMKNYAGVGDDETEDY